MDIEKLKLPIFNGEGYKDWAVRIKLILQTRHLFKYAERQVAAPKDALEAKKWEEANEETRALVLLAVKDSIRDSLLHLNSPHEVWKQLKSTYDRTSTYTIPSIINDIVSTQFAEGSSMDEYIATAETLNRRLEDLKVGLADEVLAAFIMRGLPVSYDHVVTTIQATGASKLADVKRILVAEAAKRKDKQPIGGNAFLGKGRPRYGRPKDVSPPQQPPPTPTKPSPNAKTSVTCKHCGKSHASDNCWKQYPEKRFRRTANAASTTQASSDMTAWTVSTSGITSKE